MQLYNVGAYCFMQSAAGNLKALYTDCASTIDNDSLLLLGVDFDDSEWYYNIFITTS